MLTKLKKWKNESKRQFSLDFTKHLGVLCFKKNANKIKKGDQDIFSKIYLKFKKPIFAYFKSKTRSPDLSEELTQEVFLKAFRFRESYNSQYEFSTWIWTIAKNTLSDSLRKNRRTIEVDDGQVLARVEAEEVPCKAPDPEKALMGVETQNHFEKQLNSLTDLQKKALLMRLIHRLSYQEIAKRLNLSLSAVKSVLHRAKNTLTEATQVQGLQRII